MIEHGRQPHFGTGERVSSFDIGAGVEQDHDHARGQARVHLAQLLRRVDHVSELNDPYTSSKASTAHVDKSNIPGLTGRFEDLI